jgi:very-short-patch-repair endonuclease
MDASELLKRYAAGEREFPDVEIKPVNWIRANLSEANLSDANLSDANLSYANLIGANLSYVNLSGADLSDADLSGADLSYADLSGADLDCANLSGANLSGANLTRAYLNEASLSGADLTGANLFETDLSYADLSEAKLDGTILAYQKISEELQEENLDLKEKLLLLEIQFENLVEREVERRLIANQGIKAKKLTWEGLRFRSEPEREIAKVLDEMGIMFFPLASGRVMTEEGMKTREVDFLICSRGLWGILECDGEMWHPSAAKDHKRDNDYKRNGLWFIQRFTDKECKKSPDKVVLQFLDMLHKFHEDQCYLIRGDSTRTNTSLLPTTSSLLSDDLSFENNSDLPNSLAKSFDEKQNNESLNESLSLEDIPTERDASSILMSISSTLSRLVEDTRGSRSSGNLG